jgi:hypothetical protein
VLPAKNAGFDGFEAPMTDELAPTATPDKSRPVRRFQKAGVSIAALRFPAGPNPEQPGRGGERAEGESSGRRLRQHHEL